MAYSNSNFIALKAEQLTEQQRLNFIDHFTRMLYSGKGSSSNFARQLGVSESDGLRVFLGMPAADLGERQRRVFEAVYAYTLDLPVTPRPELWTEAPEWTPINPRRRATERSIGQCQLDFEFIESFGLRRGVWEKEILLADTKAVAAKIEHGGDLGATNLRLYIALALFGFRDPAQFFV